MVADHLISIDQQPIASPFKGIWIQIGEYLGCQHANDTSIDLISTNKINDDKGYFESISQDGTSTKMFLDNVLQMEKTSINLGTEPLESFALSSVSQ
jgi:hypothetical protein